MPILVQSIINKAVRSQSPFLLRPIVNLIFNQLDTMVNSNMKKHLDMVSNSICANANVYPHPTILMVIDHSLD